MDDKWWDDRPYSGEMPLPPERMPENPFPRGSIWGISLDASYRRQRRIQRMVKRLVGAGSRGQGALKP
jgi:hypothetical protein